MAIAYQPYPDLISCTEAAGRLIALRGQLFAARVEVTKCLYVISGGIIKQSVGEPEGVQPLFGAHGLDSFNDDTARELLSACEDAQLQPAIFGADETGVDWVSLLLPIVIAYLRKRLNI